MIDGSPPRDGCTIELRSRFDPKAWQIAPPETHGGTTLLVSWTVTPDPIDAGVPACIQPVLADAFCSLGTCWFAGDEGARPPVATFRLGSPFSRRRAFIFRTDRPDDLLPAFDSGNHDWSMGAQWIIAAARAPESNDRIVPVLAAVLSKSRLPTPWPAEVAVIVQAAVDGDGAACHCRTPAIEAELRSALERHAPRHHVALQLLD